MTESYLIAATRTPQTRFLGSLASLSAPTLGACAVEEVSKRVGWDPLSIDQVIMGQVVSAGCGQAPARQAATLAGLPESVGAMTVNKVCGSGLCAVMLADWAIRAGQYHRVVAGGMESMSQGPHLMRGGRSGWKYGSAALLDALDVDGLRCAASGLPMGSIAQRVAVDFQLSRRAQDAWAARSHQRASAAASAQHFQAEIVPVTVSGSKKVIVVAQDEGPRPECTAETLSALRPAFATVPGTAGSNDVRSAETGDRSEYEQSVTAGNASSLADGAAAMAVVSQHARQSLATAWAFRIVAHTNVATAHEHLFTAPALAIQHLLQRTGRTLDSIDLIEINEAFAAQVLACNQLLRVDPDKVNVRGGAIALGHPLGCSGARVLVTLIHALLDQGLSTGIAALCLGGGEGVAMLIERAD